MPSPFAPIPFLVFRAPLPVLRYSSFSQVSALLRLSGLLLWLPPRIDLNQNDISPLFLRFPPSSLDALLFPLKFDTSFLQTV
jgi:hypothetical protein